MRIPGPQVSDGAISTGGGTNFGAVAPVQDLRASQIGQLGRGLQEAGAAVGDLGAKLQDQLDEKDALRAIANYSEQASTIDGDYRSSLGDAAVTGLQPARKGLVEAQKRVRSFLQTEQAREMYDRQAERIRLSSFAAWDGHYRTQLLNARVGEGTAFTKAQIRRYQSSIEVDPKDAEIAKGLALRQIEGDSKLMGLGAEQTADRKLMATTEMHVGVISSLVAQERGAEAAAYLGVAQGEIAPEKRDDIVRAVRRAGVAEASTQLSSFAVSQALKRKTGMGDQLQFALDTVDSTYAGKRIDADVRDAAMARVRQAFDDRRHVEVAQQVDTLQQAQQWMNAHPMADLATMPPAISAGIDKIEGGWDKVNALKANAGKTDHQAATEMMSIPDAELVTMTKEDLMSRFFGRLSEQHLQYVLNRNEALKATAANRATALQQSLLSDKDRIMNYWSQFSGITLGTPDRNLSLEQQKQRFEFFEKAIQIMTQPTPEDAKLSPMERLEKAMLETVDVAQGWVGTSYVQKPGAFLSKEQQMKSSVVTATGERMALPTVTFDQRNVVKRYLQDRKIANPTEAQIMGVLARFQKMSADYQAQAQAQAASRPVTSETGPGIPRGMMGW